MALLFVATTGMFAGHVQAISVAFTITATGAEMMSRQLLASLVKQTAPHTGVVLGIGFGVSDLTRCSTDGASVTNAAPDGQPAFCSATERVDTIDLLY